MYSKCKGKGRDIFLYLSFFSISGVQYQRKLIAWNKTILRHNINDMTLRYWAIILKCLEISSFYIFAEQYNRGKGEGHGITRPGILNHEFL